MLERGHLKIYFEGQQWAGQGEEGFLCLSLQKMSVWKGHLCLAPSAGVSASQYWVGSGHISGWKLPPSLNNLQMGLQHEKPPKERGNLNFRGAQQLPDPTWCQGFSSPDSPKSVFSFFIFVRSPPFYNGASGLGFYTFLITYSVKENEFSLQ